MSNRIKNQEKVFKYHRTCELEGCIIVFDTNRKNHYFCDPVHQQEYWKRIRGGEATARNEVRKLKKDFIKLEEDIKQIKKHLNIKES